jgi:cell division transport system permease protein
MIQLPYFFVLAVKSLLKEKWINLLSIMTIASGLLIISIAVFGVVNITAATRQLPEKFSMIVYLDDGLQKEDRAGVISSLKKNSAVHSVKYISKEEALEEMKGLLKDSDYVFEGLDENPLPDSLELKLREEAVGPEIVKKLAGETLGIKGVKEVDYGEKFLSMLHSLKTGLQTVGLVLIVILSAGIIFVCYSTVKILFYRRTEEIETYKLLGATRSFIRLPFLIEGAFLGTAGGVAGLLGILSFNYLVLMRLSLSMPLIRKILFPTDLFLLLPFIGLFLGVTGAAIALGRIRY